MNIGDTLSNMLSFAPTAGRWTLGGACLYSAADMVAGFDTKSFVGKIVASCTPKNAVLKIASAVVLSGAGTCLLLGKFPFRK